MPYNRDTADSRMLVGVLGFAQACTIQQATIGRDSTGAPTSAWADVPGLVALPCSFHRPVGGAGGQEQRAPDGTFLRSSYMVIIRGSYPAIAEAMRVVVAGVAYNILQAVVDSVGACTTITAELVA